MLLLLLLLQADSARELVEKLRSETVDAREDAEKRLRALGKAAAPELEKAAKDADDEVAGRAKRLLRILELGASLPPALLKAFPGAEDRLARGPHEWTALLLESVGHPRLGKEELDPLAAEAFRGARTDEEREGVVARVRRRGLRAGIPGLVELLHHPVAALRESAIDALRDMEAFEATPAIAELLRTPAQARSAGDAIVRMRAWRAMAKVQALLDDPEAGTRKQAVDVVRRMGAREALPRVRALLKDPDPSVRDAAVEAIGTLNDRESAGALIALANDPDPLVRRDVLWVLSEWRLPEAIPAILAGLEDREERVFLAAVKRCAELKIRAAVPVLLRQMREERVASHAVSALLAIGDPETVPELRRLLVHPAPYARRTAVEVLGAMRCREAVPEILPLLKDRETAVRLQALEALGLLGASPAAEEIAGFLKDPDPRARMKAIDALKHLKAKELGSRILPLLKDPDEQVVLRAIQAVQVLQPAGSAGELARFLGRSFSDAVRPAILEIGAREALPEIRPLLTHPNAEVRVAAVRLISEFAGGISAPDVLALLHDPDPKVQGAAAGVAERLKVKEAIPRLVELLDRKETRRSSLWALHRLGDPSVLRAVEKCLEDPDFSPRMDAVQALGALGGADAVPALVRALGDQEYDVRRWALSVLSDINGRKAIPDIIRLMEAEEDVGTQIPDVLADLGATEAIPALAKLLKADFSGTRSAGLSALARLRARDRLPEIRRALADESPMVLFMAADAVGRLEDAESIPALLGLLRHPDEWVRDSAARALAAAGSREGVPTLFRGGVSSLFELNRLRNPEAWKKLGGVTLREDIRGPVREMWEKLGTIAGLPVEIAPPAGPDDANHLKAEGRWRCRNGAATALDAMDRDSSFYEVILEPDRLRILWKDAGLKFWREWWEEEKKR